MPSATRVLSSDDRPADTSGSGTPVMGSTPITAPMLTVASITTQAVMAVAASRANISGTRRAIRSPAKASPPYRAVTHSVPMSPSSSPMVAKMKSLVDSGT